MSKLQKNAENLGWGVTKPYSSISGIQRRMVSIFVAAVAASAAFSASAFECVSNSFWDTTGYTGVAPTVSETASLADELDSWTTIERVIGPLDKPFSSYPSGLTIIFR